MSNPALRYSLYRLGIFAGLFAAVMVVFGLFDLNGRGNIFIAIAIAAAASAVISYKFLNAQRDAMSEALYNRVQAAKERIAEDNRAEDANAAAIVREAS
jgi:high-affinity Fe2+/Pb2+ permease